METVGTLAVLEPAHQNLQHKELVPCKVVITQGKAAEMKRKSISKNNYVTEAAHAKKSSITTDPSKATV